MRIAVVANTSWYLFNFRLNLMQALVHAGHAVVAVAPEDGYSQRLRAAGFEFEPVAMSGAGVNPVMELRTVWGLRSAFRRQRIDLTLSYTPKGNLYSALACLSTGAKFVVNVSGLGRAFTERSLATVIARVLYRLTFRRAHHVFFQNAEDLEAFVAGGLVPRSRATRVPGSGVDLTRFTPAVPPAARDGDAPVFLLVARMLWDKGVGEFVAAARQVRLSHPRARFALLGFLSVANPSAIPVATVQAWVDEGLVDYLGTTDDVRPHLAMADCVVLPSYYREGVPRTLLEAAAMARPIITTDMAGCRDTVVAGTSGLLCAPRDASDLARAMLSFMALTAAQRHAMGLHARAHVEGSFSESVVIDRYLQCVEALAPGA